MTKTSKQMKALVSLGALSLLGGCSMMPLASNDAQAVDSVANGQVAQRYANNDYENRIDRHIYAGLGIGASRLEPDTSEVPGVDVNDRVEGGGQVTIGMDVNRHFSLEAHSADLGSAGLSAPADRLSGRIDYHMHGASALYYVGKQRHNYRRQGLTGFGRVGVAFLENSSVGNVDFVQDNGAALLVGAGVEYMTKVGLGLRAEAISFEEDINYGQLAMVYRMGTRRTRKAVEIVKAPEPAPVVVPALKVIKPAPLPVVEAPNVCEEFDGVLEGVNFKSDSADLTPEGMRTLDRAADKLVQCDDVQLSISAHTDSVGSEAYNQGLSERRAQSVLNNLSDRGIRKSRMNAQAYGESQPIDTNSTKEGRLRNRRVEVIAQ